MSHRMRKKVISTIPTSCQHVVLVGACEIATALTRACPRPSSTISSPPATRCGSPILPAGHTTYEHQGKRYNSSRLYWQVERRCAVFPQAIRCAMKYCSGLEVQPMDGTCTRGAESMSFCKRRFTAVHHGHDRTLAPTCIDIVPPTHSGISSEDSIYPEASNL